MMNGRVGRAFPRPKPIHDLQRIHGQTRTAIFPGGLIALADRATARPP